MLDLFDRLRASRYNNTRLALSESRLQIAEHARKAAEQIRINDAKTERLWAEVEAIEKVFHAGKRQLRRDAKAAFQELKESISDGDPQNIMSSVNSSIRARLAGGR